MLNVIMLGVVMLNVIMLGVIILNVVMLSLIMLNAVKPCATAVNVTILRILLSKLTLRKPDRMTMKKYF